MIKVNGFEATRSDRLSRYGVTATAAIASVTVAGSAGAAIVTSASVSWAAQTISKTGNGPTTGGNGGVINTFGDALLSAPRPGNLFNGPVVSIVASGGVRLAYFNNAKSDMSLATNSGLARFGNNQLISSSANSWADGPFLSETIVRSNISYGSAGAFGWNLGGTGAASVRGFLAFRIYDGVSDYFYGYFDVEVSRTGIDLNSTLSVTIHGWAYNNVAGDPIFTPSASAVPGGTGLAALAVGAAGLRGRRRSRN